jgi:hypothetical protein
MDERKNVTFLYPYLCTRQKNNSEKTEYLGKKILRNFCFKEIILHCKKENFKEYFQFLTFVELTFPILINYLADILYTYTSFN